ncbi:NAD-dependent epimerase/dehydratase family protein [Marinivivus vitaminiproducens]|uniref:NAD-dependent epimerase/dehydratase family protein n=1 Tax=Marinivivus vitaminiproducens TaxID=3035935 RepID=UPI0027A2B6F3|nr:NAD(P)-dependent oxidoreductase [Geminicoccaceae bacterium SCSIO 64248]
MTQPQRPVLVTGASGALGKEVSTYLAGLGWPLVMTDIAPFPGEVPKGCRFEIADLVDRAAIARLAEGCGTILHFGGVSYERPFEEVLGPNISGLYHIFEAARSARARVVFASSVHAIGFHERATPLDAADPHMPDGYYGLSKVYGEMVGRLYWMRNGVESISLRIGSCLPEPNTHRALSTWLSYGDLDRFCEKATLADAVGCCVIWGCSANSAKYWHGDARARIGWEPQDSADPYAEKLANEKTDDPIAERYQGGIFTSMDYDRDALPDSKPYPKR